MATALSVFPYGMRVLNFLAVSDSPIHFDRNLWFSTLEEIQIDGQHLFDPANPATQRVFARYARLDESLQRQPVFNGLETGDSLRQRIGKLRVITDDNMGLEWEPNVQFPWRIETPKTQVASR